jgi:hypothetical protein
MLDECTPTGRTAEVEQHESRTDVSFLDPQPLEGRSAGLRTAGAGDSFPGSNTHFIAGIEIHTEYARPPIPSRDHDWNATTANYEPGDPIGRGSTERKAINDLFKQLDADGDIEHACYECGAESTHEIRTRFARGWVWLKVCDECDQDQGR